jgi:CheY-like chemotaxis protein
VLRQYKSSALIQKVPVIVLTTSAEDRDIDTAYQLGANSYIVKPVEFEKFLEVAGQIDLYWNMINMPPR